MCGFFRVINIAYGMHAVSQSLPMSVESTFEGVDGRCFKNMVWQCNSRHLLTCCLTDFLTSSFFSIYIHDLLYYCCQVIKVSKN